MDWKSHSLNENDWVKILWDFQIHTDKFMMANQPHCVCDIVLMDKQRQKAVETINVVIQSNSNILLYTIHIFF